MAEQNFKRNVAYKLRIESILSGNPNLNGDRFLFLQAGDRNVVRVNVAGIITDRYESTGEKNYLFLTIDDGSGQIKIKVFGEDSEKFRSFQQGQTTVVIGVLRYFNNEIYISPEIMKPVDSKYLVLRKLEVEKTEEGNNVRATNNHQQPLQIREKIIELIRRADSNGGIDLENLISSLSAFPAESINSEIQKLLEEGVIFEPRPGKIRWLG